MKKKSKKKKTLKLLSTPIKGKKKKLVAKWDTSNPTFTIYYPVGLEVRYWM